mmetsp:Transcript_6811/g.16439  ORF Transcript_6811/g.16439 Transcript_6811/m.16439 type:complete len:213 (-) Transcript_6811:682-1320(-)
MSVAVAREFRVILLCCGCGSASFASEACCFIFSLALAAADRPAHSCSSFAGCFGTAAAPLVAEPAPFPPDGALAARGVVFELAEEAGRCLTVAPLASGCLLPSSRGVIVDMLDGGRVRLSGGFPHHPDGAFRRRRKLWTCSRDVRKWRLVFPLWNNPFAIPCSHLTVSQPFVQAISRVPKNCTGAASSFLRWRPFSISSAALLDMIWAGQNG